MSRRGISRLIVPSVRASLVTRALRIVPAQPLRREEQAKVRSTAASRGRTSSVCMGLAVPYAEAVASTARLRGSDAWFRTAQSTRLVAPVMSLSKRLH